MKCKGPFVPEFVQPTRLTGLELRGAGGSYCWEALKGVGGEKTKGKGEEGGKGDQEKKVTNQGRGKVKTGKG